jgi:hypothetical protein
MQGWEDLCWPFSWGFTPGFHIMGIQPSLQGAGVTI